jgi:hypothetical protein
MNQKIESDHIEDNQLRIRAQKILLHQKIHKLLEEWDQQRKNKSNSLMQSEIIEKKLT